MRGETKIELIKDGKVIKTYEDRNMVTNAISDALGNNPFGNVDYNKLLPISKMINGLYLFGENIATDAKNTNIQVNNPPIAWAGDSVNTDITNYPDRGSFNVLESELIDSHQLKFVWDFSTKQANKTFKCLGLTSAVAGNCNEFDSNRFIDVDIAQMNIIGNNETIEKAQCFNYKKNLWYYIKPVLGTAQVVTENGTETLYQVTGLVVDVARRGAYKIPFTQDNTDNIGFTVGSYTYNLQTPFTYRKEINGLAGGKYAIMSVDYDAEADIVNIYGILNGASKLSKIILTPAYIADQFNGFTITQIESVVNIGDIYTNYVVAIFDGYIPKDVLPVVDGYLYLAFASDTINYSNFVDYANGDLRYKLYKVEIANTANVSIVNSEEEFISIFTKPIPAPMYGVTMKSEHTYYGHEFTIVGGKVYLVKNPDDYENTIGDYAHEIGNNFVITRGGKILINSGYLATINNLQDEVTKTSDVSMKITYIVKDI